uniref:Prenyltransferase alpha-alpha toroid domain-containing protein n=1 Tax=Lotharella oceanica TaxID=641309 RepID=A0A7S2TT83_9EUKA
MTYSALCALRILGDDLKKVDKKAIVSSLKLLQRENGCFRCATSEEDDMRFMYCACVISDMLGDWSGVNKEAAVKYIVESQAFDGGIGLRIGAEGHGGTTYCAVASLVLMGRLDALKDYDGLVRWCVYGQGQGFVGRPNKPPDSCYSFWIGATMMMLGVYDLTAANDNRHFNLRCQTKWGGFGKYPDVHPDILHSYFGICGLSMMGMDGLRPIDPVWGITQRAAGKEKKKN